MAMEVADEDDVWGALAASPSASPRPVISTALSLNTRLQLPAASGGPFLPGVGVSTPSHPGGGCYNRDVAASPSSSFPRLASLDTGPARRALEHEMCLGPSPAATVAGTSGGPVERRKKRMIKNLESANRSRARKKAHATQIETEAMALREANEQLRVKYEQLKATLELSMPVKKTLQRVLSAPF